MTKPQCSAPPIGFRVWGLRILRLKFGLSFSFCSSAPVSTEGAQWIVYGDAVPHLRQLQRTEASSEITPEHKCWQSPLSPNQVRALSESLFIVVL